MANKKTDNEGFEFAKIFARYIDRWKLYFITILLSLFLGYIFITYSTPKYQASTKLLIQSAEQSGSSALLDLSGLFSTKNSVYDEITILTTTDLLTQVVKALNLNVKYFNYGQVNSKEVYNLSPFSVQYIGTSLNFQPVSFRLNAAKDNSIKITDSKSDREYQLKLGDTLRIPDGILVVKATRYNLNKNKDYLFTIKPVFQAADDLSKNIIVDYTNTLSSIISLTYNTSVPAEGIDVLTTLIQKYFQRNLTEKNRVADSGIAFIDSRIIIVEDELNRLETEIERFKQSNKITDISLQASSVTNNSQEYYNKLNDIEVQMNVAKTTLDYLQDSKNNFRPVPSLLDNDPIFLQLTSKYNELQLQRDQLTYSLQDNNIIITNLEDQIKNVRAGMIKSLQSQLRTLQLSKNQVEIESKTANTGIYNIPRQEKTYVSLSRERDVEQELYLYLLQKKEETALTKASNIASATVVDSPKCDAKPFFPNSSLVYTICVFLGLFFPTLFIVGKHALNNKILNRDDITKLTDTTIIAEISHTRNINFMATKNNDRSITGEQFRILRTNMNFLTGQSNCPRILVTSSMSGEGKSFISANLALIYAFAGKKVLLMEMDLRKPHLSSMLQCKNSKGFTDYIITGSNIEDLIQPVKISENLFFLSSGPIPPNPAELIVSKKMDLLMEKLSGLFEIIIIDTPPIGIITDAQILSKYSDVNLFAVREGYTFKNNLSMIDELIETERLKDLYIVVNDVTKGAAYKYGYGYGYVYAYGSENYYGPSQKKKSRFSNIFRRNES